MQRADADFIAPAGPPVVVSRTGDGADLLDVEPRSIEQLLRLAADGVAQRVGRLAVPTALKQGGDVRMVAGVGEASNEATRGGQPVAGTAEQSLRLGQRFGPLAEEAVHVARSQVLHRVPVEAMNPSRRFRHEVEQSVGSDRGAGGLFFPPRLPSGERRRASVEGLPTGGDLGSDDTVALVQVAGAA